MDKNKFYMHINRIKFLLFMFITRLLSIINFYFKKILVFLLVNFPEKYINFTIPIIKLSIENYDSDSDLLSDSDSDDEKINNNFPIDSNLCISLYDKIINNEITQIKENSKKTKFLEFNNDYIFNKLNKIKTNASYYIIFSELMYLYQLNQQTFCNSIEITKKINLMYKLDNTLNTKIIKRYFNNPDYIFIVYYCFYTNMTKFKLLNIKKNTDIINNKIIMFGDIKL